MVFRVYAEYWQLPDRQCTGGLFWQLWWVDEHELEQKLQVSNVSGQTGANEPCPVPTLALTPAPKVHNHCVEIQNTHIFTIPFKGY